MADDITSSYTAVDLSQLPAPNVIATLDYETEYANFAALVQSLNPDFDPLDETDPAVAVAQVAAYQILILKQAMNDKAKAVLVAYAEGSDLDNLAALFGIARQTITPADADTGTAAVMEPDPDFRRRLVLAPESYSVAGPEGAYISLALDADASRVLDASAIGPEDQPGTVLVTILSRLGDTSSDGTAPADLIATVSAYLSDDTRRPLTDKVTVQSAAIVDYAIEASITTFSGPDSSIVLAQAQANAAAYVADSFRLGRDITRAALFAAINCPGVQNTILTSPAADISIDRTQAAFCTGIQITYAGLGE